MVSLHQVPQLLAAVPGWGVTSLFPSNRRSPPVVSASLVDPGAGVDAPTATGRSFLFESARRLPSFPIAGPWVLVATAVSVLKVSPCCPLGLPHWVMIFLLLTPKCYPSGAVEW